MIVATKQLLQRYFLGRSVAYARVFDKENEFTNTVLADLAKFCRAHDSTYHPDPRVHAQLEGRREVWLRIQENLKLNIDEIYQLHRIKQGEST